MIPVTGELRENTTMTVIRSAIVGALAVGLLAACGSSGSDAPKASGSKTPSAPASAKLSSDDAYFVKGVREKRPDAYGVLSDKELLDLAHGVCDIFAKGGGGQALTEFGQSSILDAGDWGYAAGFGVGTFCPQYIDQFKAIVNAASAQDSDDSGDAE
ncbi:MAG: hypothetical protein QM572_05825 [Nocardioides sp.]|uniref:hypothetical protein n=1 Tax=Nocardioides sp. TaxID=35761 RepID=UPI0039E38E68